MQIPDCIMFIRTVRSLLVHMQLIIFEVIIIDYIEKGSF